MNRSSLSKRWLVVGMRMWLRQASLYSGSGFASCPLRLIRYRGKVLSLGSMRILLWRCGHACAPRGLAPASPLQTQQGLTAVGTDVVHVLAGQAHSPNVVLLLRDAVALGYEHVQADVVRVEHWESLLANQASAELSHVSIILCQVALHYIVLDPLQDLLVVRARPDGTEEVQWLVGERVQQCVQVRLTYIVFLVHLGEDIQQFRAARLPVKFCHAPIPDEGRKQGTEVVPGDNDRDAADDIPLTPVPRARHPCGVITDVHQRRHHYLIVYGGLRVFEVPNAGVDVVNDQGRHLAAHLGHLAGLPVPLPDHAARSAGPLMLQLPSAHDHRFHSELLEGQLGLERFPAPLRSPDAQDQRQPDARQALPHKVLRHVDCHSIQERRRYEVVPHDVLVLAELVPPQAAVRNV
mmetsp:Transcript_19317/g.58375  ORF Transcript_19317/g.58375 Transcript_19317/m.58375 type:complete len:408 (+) Transcript_19317:539-1762(+)